MSILSRIKSFLAKPLSLKYFANSLSNETIYLKGNVYLNINGISITITEDKDIIINDVRFFEVNSSKAVLLNCKKNAEKLKKLKLEGDDKIKEHFKVTPAQLIESRKKYETRR